jgi:hypothetical protein
MPWFPKREIHCQYTATFVDALLHLCQHSFVCCQVAANDERWTRHPFEILEARSEEMVVELLVEARDESLRRLQIGECG